MNIGSLSISLCLLQFFFFFLPKSCSLQCTDLSPPWLNLFLNILLFLMLLLKGLFSFFLFWLRCAAFGILVPQPGIKPGLTAVKAPSPNRWTARGFPHFAFVKGNFSIKCPGFALPKVPVLNLYPFTCPLSPGSPVCLMHLFLILELPGLTHSAPKVPPVPIVVQTGDTPRQFSSLNLLCPQEPRKNSISSNRTFP